MAAPRPPADAFASEGADVVERAGPGMDEDDDGLAAAANRIDAKLPALPRCSVRH